MYIAANACTGQHAQVKQHLLWMVLMIFRGSPRCSSTKSGTLVQAKPLANRRRRALEREAEGHDPQELHPGKAGMEEHVNSSTSLEDSGSQELQEASAALPLSHPLSPDAEHGRHEGEAGQPGRPDSAEGNSHAKCQTSSTTSFLGNDLHDSQHAESAAAAAAEAPSTNSVSAESTLNTLGSTQAAAQPEPPQHSAHASSARGEHRLKPC